MAVPEANQCDARWFPMIVHSYYVRLAVRTTTATEDVDPLPRAVFTNGPVMLGMASMVDQPIGIDTQYNRREPVLGVTLDNLWSKGDIEEGGVKEFIVMVPNDFDLVKCDRWYPDTKRQPFKSEEGYDFYRFTKEEIGDPRASFQSVTCRLH